MENSIVKDFQNLHVLNTVNFERMDELVQDLTNALEETVRTSKSKNVDNTYARRCKKRRTRKRRPNGTGKDVGNLSEASESSIDEALKDYMENVFQQSDSDDIIAARRLSSLPLATLGHALSLAESDSVTENFSPLRLHRRRRKCKRMAIDPQPNPDLLPPTLKPKFKRMRSKAKTLEARTDNVMDTDSTMQYLSQCSKQSEEQAGECSTSMETNKNGANNTQESSSSLSSSESDCGGIGIFTNDEGREGDDEQSDFFHEAGPACGIPGIIPWWENEDDSTSQYDPNFQKILTGTFDYLSNSSKRNFKTRVSKLFARREIWAARRRLQSRRRGYPISRLQQQVAEPSHNEDAMFICSGCATSPPTQNDIKRRRKTPPSTPSKKGYVGEEADPIPESNKGQQILRNMGWTPGMGLGASETGIITPVMAFMRPKRRGLGAEEGENS